MFALDAVGARPGKGTIVGRVGTTPNLPTKIIPTQIAWLKIPRKSPVDMRIPPLIIEIMLESNPLKSRILVWRLAESDPTAERDDQAFTAHASGRAPSEGAQRCAI